MASKALPDIPDGNADLVAAWSEPIVPTLHPNGKPYAITQAQIKVLVEMVQKGLPFTSACKLAAVSYETFCNWMVKGGDPKSDAAGKPAPGEEVEPYRSFVLAMRAAEASAEEAMVEALTGAASKDWRAAAHYLARRNPKEWGEQKQQTNIGVQGGQVVITLPDNGRDAPLDGPASPDEF